MITYFFIAPYPLDVQNLPNLRRLSNFLIPGEFNPTKTDKTIQLEAPYYDVKKTLYTGTVVLKPFESIVLVKDVKSLPNTSSSLKNFRSSLEECQIKLFWNFEVDNNFSLFEVEKSDDGNTFTKIATINKLSGTGLQSYQYLDADIGDVNYYRLKRVDLDGNFTYSDVIEEQTDCNRQSFWQIYPNLVNTGNGGFSIDLFTKETLINFTIVDQLGRQVKNFKAETKAGWNKLNWNIDDLSAGMYYLHRSDVLLNRALPFIVSKNF